MSTSMGASVRHAALMSQIMMGWLCVTLAAMSTVARGADPEPDPIDVEIGRVEMVLDHIGREQQSVYQQFQMVQELRRSEAQEGYQSQLVYTPPITPPNYEDLRAQEDDRQARLRDYKLELDRLYARYKDLEAQKQPLLDRISELAQERTRAQ